jgi:hypothetical protein
VGGQVISQNKTEWTSIKNNINKLLKDHDSNAAMSAYCIIEHLIPNAASFYQDIVEILKHELANESSEHKVSSLRCLGAYVKEIDNNHSKMKLNGLA